MMFKGILTVSLLLVTSVLAEYQDKFDNYEDLGLEEREYKALPYFPYDTENGDWSPYGADTAQKPDYDYDVLDQERSIEEEKSDDKGKQKRKPRPPSFGVQRGGIRKPGIPDRDNPRYEELRQSLQDLLNHRRPKPHRPPGAPTKQEKKKWFDNDDELEEMEPVERELDAVAQRDKSPVAESDESEDSREIRRQRWKAWCARRPFLCRSWWRKRFGWKGRSGKLKDEQQEKPKRSFEDGRAMMDGPEESDEWVDFDDVEAGGRRWAQPVGIPRVPETWN